MGAEEDLAAALDKNKELEAEVEKWKGFSRKHETRATENAAAAAELQQLKEATLSDQQKREKAEKEQAAKLDALTKRADEADARALRAEVASAKGLNAAQAKRLAGATREELEADADELLESFKPAESEGEPDKGGKTLTPRERPRERLRGGGDPTEEPEETDPRKLAERIPRR